MAHTHSAKPPFSPTALKYIWAAGFLIEEFSVAAMSLAQKL